MCQVGVCNEGRWSSMEIGLSKGGKWVFNTACTMSWCHISKGSGLSSTVISNVLRKTRTQLGPSSSLAVVDSSQRLCSSTTIRQCD